MSKVLLHCLGVTEQVYVTADPVFSLPPPDEEYARRKVSLLNLPETYICICVRHWYDTHPLIPVKIATRLKIRNKKNIAMYMRYVETLAQTVDRINENLDLPVVFLSMCHGRDASVAEDILLRTKNAKKCHCE